MGNQENKEKPKKQKQICVFGADEQCFEKSPVAKAAES